MLKARLSTYELGSGVRKHKHSDYGKLGMIAYPNSPFPDFLRNPQLSALSYQTASTIIKHLHHQATNINGVPVADTLQEGQLLLWENQSNKKLEENVFYPNYLLGIGCPYRQWKRVERPKMLAREESRTLHGHSSKGRVEASQIERGGGGHIVLCTVTHHQPSPNSM